jgi:pimeloyl-ACP methyl ester carboxylesterase
MPMVRAARRHSWPAAVAAGLVLFTACAAIPPDPTPSPSTAATFAPAFVEEACPTDVEVTLLVDHACGSLTVLQNRAAEDGGTVRLLVVRLNAPEGATAADPVLVAGADIGDELQIGSFAPLVTRVQRTVYVLEPRGVGHAQPLLACPEVDELAVDVVEAPSGDVTVRERFLAAVGACRKRLVEEGVDIGSFGVADAAADIEDLRLTLGIPRWNLISYGSNSRFVLESVRQFPVGVRAVAIDSPEFPQFGPEVDPEAMVHAMGELAAACASEPACASVAPEVETLLQQAVARLDAAPLDIEVADASGTDDGSRPVSVRLDGRATIRAVRSALGGDGPSNATRLPAAIAEASAGQPSRFLAEILANDPVLCAGYRPLCPRQPRTFSLGVYLDVLCGDIAPFLDEDQIAVTVRDSPYRSLFEDNPYLAACDVWATPPSEASFHEPFATDLPVLIMVGRLDSYSSPSAAMSAAATLPNGFVVEVPGQTHNVLGFTECTLDIRNAFINDPETRPDTGCLGDLAITFDMTSD